MADIVDSILQVEPVAGSDRLRVTFATADGTHAFEFTQAAIEALLPGLLSQPREPGKPTLAANAITPVGCLPFESMQGLCGLAFNLGERSLHIGVPPNGIESVRTSLDMIEIAYRDQKMPRMPS